MPERIRLRVAGRRWLILDVCGYRRRLFEASWRDSERRAERAAESELLDRIAIGCRFGERATMPLAMPSSNSSIYKRIFLRALISCAVATLGFTRPARADLDQRWFVGNFLGYSAQPENYFSIAGGIDRSQNFESLYAEKTFSSKSSIALYAGYQRLQQDGESTAGWSNLTLLYKLAVVTLPQHEFVLSISPAIELPFGAKSVGSESHPRAGFDVLLDQGFVDLPDWLRMMRPGAVESDVGFDKKVTGVQDDLVFVNSELEYSLTYLDRFVIGNRLPVAIRNLTPHLDFDYEQYLSAHRNPSAPYFSVTPAVAWLNSIFEVNLGVAVGLNHTSTTSGAVAFVWLVGISPDQIIPALGWTPIR